MKVKTIRMAAAVLLMGLGLGPVAVADDAVEIRVAYSDLDVYSVSDATELYDRIKRAAREACGVEYYWRNRDLSQISKAKRCYKAALSKAVQDVNSDVLADIHRRKAGKDA